MIRRTLTSAVLAALFVAGSGRASQAQVAREQLSTADARFAEAFSLVNALRPLADGRVLVADPLGQALLVVDFATGAADTIGRVGQGPTEYRQPDAVFPLPGDSTLLVDLGNARLTVLGPDLSFGPTLPIAQGEFTPGLAGMTLVLPQAVDGRGQLYFRRLGMRPGGALPDSAPLVRFDRETGQVDTVATIKIQEMRQSTGGGPNNRRVAVTPIPLSPEDGWAVAPDGRVALVRANPYSVEWVQPDGRVVRGPSIDYRPVAIRSAEKEEWGARLGAGLGISVSVTNGRPQMAFRRGGNASDFDPTAYEWPAQKPAFDPGSVFAAADGRLWVARSVPAGAAPVYDVFDASGRLAAQVTLPAGRRVIHVGAGVLYTVTRDEFDLQYLERFRFSS